MGRYRQLLRYVRPYLALVVAALVATVLGTLFDGFTFALVIPFLVAAFVILYVYPTETERLFAWKLQPTMSAMMLAAAYAGGMTIEQVKEQHREIDALNARTFAMAQRLESEGIAVEVIDPRTLIPLDEETILASVAKTNRVVIADDHQILREGLRQLLESAGDIAISADIARANARRLGHSMAEELRVLLSRAMDQTADGLGIYAEDGTILWANAAAARFYGVRAVPAFAFFVDGALVRRLSLRDVRALAHGRSASQIRAALARPARRPLVLGAGRWATGRERVLALFPGVLDLGLVALGPVGHLFVGMVEPDG